MARTCAACGALLTLLLRGRTPRFCGTACRMVAYRRRRQQLPEQTPRWDGPRGKLRLSRRDAFDQEQEEKARRQAARTAWEQGRAERERHRAQEQAVRDQQAAAEAARKAVADYRARQLAHRLASRPPR